ncbi:16S rRNA (guanine(527)-N(7))-methyltransferase RsmG [Sphingomonas sp. LaA6.9]|uniref:16S rRNA (guanine(527)-N(7))-methyltransferase RsmG n=1 Tax=Sphingomonas sp. LaA6.9 TaxID=2919914 RepID=UPI001F4FB92C|nr:16S rRNA (guanine(527)-N(7))-methyltransferase RsmG [Sphingomonas sp. LaA6.9]MCJ8159598.1 16S rRNA (guanine(527)-N(7))-methyltransferase RsmG [Sphingomonas sp. LaA6.9]
MTEDEARAWLDSEIGVSRETIARIETFIGFLFEEGERQNLIATSTRDHVWARHIVDSAQLLPLAREAADGAWVDLGSGAGFPGLIVAALSPRPVVLVESRRKRIEFLEQAARLLGVTAHVIVLGGRVETVPAQPAAVISARAFAPLDRLFTLGARFSRSGTLWLLPKGRNAQSELEAARNTWQGVFHVKQSVTDADSSIIVAQGVKRGKS